MDRKMDVGLICMLSHNSKAGLIPLTNLIKLLNCISDETFSILINVSGDTSRVDKTKANLLIHEPRLDFLSNAAQFVILQLKVTYHLLKMVRKVNVWIFFMGTECFLIPVIFIKLFRKKSIFVSAGSITECLKSSSQKDLHLKLIEVVSTIVQHIADYMILYSPSLISEWNLEKYRHKILIAHRHFLDFNTFTVTTPLPNRPPLIGYIGRLSGEKGVQHFAQALPTIFSDRKDLHALIGGDGQLKGEISISLLEEGVITRVDLPGWISHGDLPRYLNQLSLLILPSYTEGLPNIMLEAMACGTPVLAAPVGAIPDVIVDGRTGFIMENNSPECIAANVIRVLNSPEIEQIAENGRRFVGEHFTFERVVAKWKEVLEER